MSEGLAVWGDETIRLLREANEVLHNANERSEMNSPRIGLMQTATALAHRLLPAPKVADVDACYEALYRIESNADGRAILRENELQIQNAELLAALKEARSELRGCSFSDVAEKMYAIELIDAAIAKASA